MPRGYRSIILAAFGCLILCGAKPPSEQAQGGKRAEQATPSAQPFTSPTPTGAASQSHRFAAYTGYDPDPCYHAQDHDAADLCAQWRAAIAAEKAAHEARRATTWSIVATLLSAISLAAVAVALYLTVESNRIARDTAKRSLRAYVTVEPTGIFEKDDRGHRWAGITLNNGGETPAYKIRVRSAFVLTENPNEFEPSDVDGLEPQEDFGPIVASGIDHNVYAALPAEPSAEQWGLISAYELAIFHYGKVVYEDIFQEEHSITFAHYHWGPELSDAHARRSRKFSRAD